MKFEEHTKMSNFGFWPKVLFRPEPAQNGVPPPARTTCSMKCRVATCMNAVCPLLYHVPHLFCRRCCLDVECPCPLSAFPTRPRLTATRKVRCRHGWLLSRAPATLLLAISDYPSSCSSAPASPCSSATMQVPSPTTCSHS
jgi:hypothetical protein